VTDDVLINGQPLPAGSYSLHSIPGKEEWTIIFNKIADQGGSFNYDSKQDALRVKTKPSWTTDNQEALAFSIEPSSDDSATVALRWEKIRVPFTMQVKEAVATTLSKARAAVAAAKPDDFNTPFQAANYARDKKEMTDANAWYEQALKVADAEIAKGETYRGYARKFNALAALGRTKDAIPAGEKAVALAKAATPKIDTAALEKRIADMKAGKQ
jgi:tetratricopeptide (TPR) repeat protein